VLDPTIATDAHGKVILASASVERSSLEADELCGQNVKVLVPEPHRGNTTPTWRATADGRHAHPQPHARVRGRPQGRRRLVCELSVARAEVPGSSGRCSSARSAT